MAVTCEVSRSGLGFPQIDCHPDTTGEAAGKDVAALALHDPAQARQLLDLLMTALPDGGARRGVARGLAQALPHELLRRLGESADGRALLERARAELKSDLGDDTNEWASTQIDSALKSADLRHDPAFQTLDPASQQDVLAQVDYPLAQPAVADNTIALAKSPGFAAASPATRKELLTALSQHGGDTIYRKGLENLASDAAFQKLSPTQQASAIASFSAAAGRESYQGTSGGVFGFGARSVSDADKRQVLANAQKVVTSQGFQNIGPAAKHAIMDALNEHATSTAFTDRLLRLTNDPGFAAVNDATKQVDLLDTYGASTSFAAGIDTVTAAARYTALNATQRSQVLSDIAKLRETASYKDASAPDRQALVEIIGDICAQSAADPANTTLRNTVNQVVDGKIKIGLYQRAPFQSHGMTFYNWGDANKSGIRLNIDKDVRTAAAASNEYLDTLAHEANHKLNGLTDAASADRFLDEYRAAVVGHETALGRKLSPDEQKAVLDNLVDGTNSDYSPLANLYNHDAKFKAAVDAMYTTLNGSTNPTTHAVTPPATVEPEDARQRLRNAGNDSDYLKKAGNLDNH